MYQPIKEILIATKLSKSFVSAFETAVFIAIPYNASLVLMYQLEDNSNGMIDRVKELIGEKRLNETYLNNDIIPIDGSISKEDTIKIIQSALKHFVEDSGIDDRCSCTVRKIVVVEGEFIEQIVNQATKNKSDLIVIDVPDEFLSQGYLGQTVASVMNETHIPIMLIPKNGFPG
ncbi:universal stress protein [Desulfosarcina widdelii]|uniref:universal stress protein n=1 Tax=Desulfosarcina widdelii TaxID=947919 RepID=UPI0012D3189B|nr:universal stress protein [Desulfosarcina widdelii]